MSFNKRQHLADNLQALKIAFAKTSDRVTDAEREILSRFSGFGGIKSVLYPAVNDADISQ